MHSSSYSVLVDDTLLLVDVTLTLASDDISHLIQGSEVYFIWLIVVLMYVCLCKCNVCVKFDLLNASPFLCWTQCKQGNLRGKERNILIYYLSRLSNLDMSNPNLECPVSHAHVLKKTVFCNKKPQFLGKVEIVMIYYNLIQ